ncbi:MAG: GAF domain-containing protein, partial [Chloroflexota bacterium]
ALEGIRLVELTQVRARRLQATNEVTRTSTSILDTDILLPMIVRQISEAFGYYHTQIFLIDPAGEWAVLRASTGEVGQELLNRGHKLMVGSHSVIGQVTSRGEPVIALDTDINPIHQRNELLPDTRAEMAIPLKTGERIIGALDVQSISPNAFDPEAQAILQSLADQVAVTLENAQLFQEIQDRVAELSTVNLVSQAVSRTDTLEDLYEVVTRELLRTFGAQYAIMAVLDDRGRLALPVIIREGRRMSVLAPPPIDEHLMRQVMDSQKILLLNEDVQASIETTGAVIPLDNPKSLLIAPLMLADDAIGVIGMVDMDRERAFTDADVRQLGTLSAYIAVKIHNTRLVELAQARAHHLQGINEVTQTATSILDTDILLPMIVRQISEVFGYYHTQIFLVDPADEWAVLQASTGEVGQELLNRGHKLMVGSHSVIGQVTLRGEPVIALDTDTDPIHQRNELLPDTRAEMAIPLKTGERIIGALDVQSTSPYTFDLEAQAILQSLADQVAVTLENTRLFQEIQDRVAELSTVNLVSQAVSRTDTLEDLYEVVTRELLRTFGVQHAVMAVLDEKRRLALPITIQEGRRVSEVAQSPIDERLMRRVMDSQEILLVNENVQAYIKGVGAEVIGEAPRSLLIAPLMLADDAIGAICMLDREHEGAFSDADVRQLGTLSAYIAVKTRNAELLDETQQRADELGFLFDMTRAAVASADLNEALQGVAEVVSHEIKDAESVVIYLANPEAGYLEPEAAVGYGREMLARQKHINWGDGPVGEVATRRNSRVIDDIERESYDLEEGNRLRSAILVPLQAGRQFSGVLAVESTRSYAFGEQELRLLETASGSLNAVIQNARLLEQITQAHEQLRELDQLKSQFLANMSHELRTPLNSIIGFSRVMLKGIDGPLNDLQSQDLETIHESGQHLLGLINNILDMSKIEAGKMELQMEYTDLEEIIEAAVTTGRGLVQDKPIELVKVVDPGLPQVYCDPIRIRQILLNLVSNATKFTEKGTITVRANRVASDPSTSTPAHVQVDVSDTGIGIADEDRGKIFEAFRQVDGSPTRQAGGTGLGLAISKEFVDMHQGWMWVESVEGVGSTFCFSLPIHPAGQDDPDLVVMPEYEDKRPIVLAVDDEPGVIDLYRRYLEKEGYGIVGLRSANDLLFHIRQIQPFVVLLDLHLPGRDGWDAWDDIKRAEDTRDLPVIVCSIDDNRQQGLARGVEGYLIKPIIEDDLLEAVQRVQRGGANGHRTTFTVERLLLIAPPEAALQVREALGDSLGCAIQTADTGRDGLQAALDQPPDLILLDADLPDMDGYGLLVAMRSQTETSRFPVILLTRGDLSDAQLAAVDRERTRVLNRDMYPGSQLADGLLSELNNLQRPTS